MQSVQVRASFTALLGLLGTLLVVGPLLTSHHLIPIWVELATIAAMIVAVLRLVPQRWVRAVVVIVGAASITTLLVRVFAPSDPTILVAHLIRILFVLLIAAIITHSIWTENEVTADTIAGGIVVYVLLAVAWSGAYQALEFAFPGSFVASNTSAGNWGPWETSPGIYPRLFFFSFVTLTTLGYGDLVPASIPAAGLTSAEAIVGPLYLTVLIARLVGLHLAGSRIRTGESEPPG